MEAMRRAQEEAKVQIEASRLEAEQAAREKLEHELQAATMARKAREAELVAAKIQAREEIEREIQAERERVIAEARGKREGPKKRSLGALLLQRGNIASGSSDA